MSGVFDDTGAIIRGAGALAGLVVPATLLVTVVKLPAEETVIAGTVATLASIAIILAVAMQGRSVRTVKPRRAAMLLLGTVAIGAVLTVGYLRLANRQVHVLEMLDGVDGPATKSFILPLQPSPWLEAQREGHGSWALAIARDRRVVDAVYRENGGAVAALIALLVLAQGLLVAGIVGGAWYLAARAPRRSVQPAISK